MRPDMVNSKIAEFFTTALMAQSSQKQKGPIFISIALGIYNFGFS